MAVTNVTQLLFHFKPNRDISPLGTWKKLLTRGGMKAITRRVLGEVFRDVNFVI